MDYISGEMVPVCGQVTQTLPAGDTLDVPANRKHTEVTGHLNVNQHITKTSQPSTSMWLKINFNCMFLLLDVKELKCNTFHLI